LHWRKLLPWRNSSGAQLSMRQKLDYCSGGLQWLSDPVTFLFTVLLLVNSLYYVLNGHVMAEPFFGAGLFVPFVFIVLSLLRTIWGLRVRLDCTTFQAFRALLVLLSLTWVVTLACFQGLTRVRGVFLRTSKQGGRHQWLHSIRIINTELLIALICAVTAAWLTISSPAQAAVWLLSGLLFWQMFIYGAALFVTHWSLTRNQA